MTTTNEKSTADLEEIPDMEESLPRLNVFSQNHIFYWWPVWLAGFIMAAISYSSGTHVETTALNEHIHPSTNPGLIFVLILLTVIIFTNFSFRGATSLGVLAGIAIISLSFALLGWWDAIFSKVSQLSIHMNVGFYLLFSFSLFVIWLYATFVHVRFNYYRIRPGQISKVHLVGEGETNYDARGAVLEKCREDLFRHWILGLGSGDIVISTSGARSEEILIKDVLFVDIKIAKIRKLVSVQPDDLVEVE